MLKRLDVYRAALSAAVRDGDKEVAKALTKHLSEYLAAEQRMLMSQFMFSKFVPIGTREKAGPK